MTMVIGLKQYGVLEAAAEQCAMHEAKVFGLGMNVLGTGMRPRHATLAGHSYKNDTRAWVRCMFQSTPG